MDDLSTLVEQAAARQAECALLREIIVDRLALPIDPGWITDDQPLFGRGLELDSVDALELMVGIEDHFGATITDDETDVFGSVNALLDRIHSEIDA